MSEARTLLFTPAQRRLVGFAVAAIAFLVVVALLVFSVWVLGRVLSIFANVIWPLAVAGILALILRPVVGLVERRLKLSRVLSVLVIYTLALVAFVGVLLLFVPELVQQVVKFIDTVPELWRRATQTITEAYPTWIELYNRAIENETLRKIIEGTTAQLQEMAVAFLPNIRAAGGTVLGVFGFTASLAVIPVYLYFFLQSDEDPAGRLHEYLPFLKDETRQDVVFLVGEFLGIVVAFFRGQLVIGLIMGVLLAFGFTVAGLEFGVIFGLLAGLLNIVPYLGTIIGLAAVLPTAYFQEGGGLLLVALCLGVFILVQMLEGYFLTPRIMGQRTGLHPVTIIIAIFFWGTALNGVLGMILAIPLTAFMVTVWRLAKRKYFRQVV